MGDKMTEREYELKEHLQELERQKDDLDESARRIRQQEEDGESERIQSNRMIEQMESVCTSKDTVILQLLEEKQQMLVMVKNKRTEFEEEFEHEVAKKKQQIDYEVEEVHMDLNSVEKQKEEEQSDNESVDGEEADDNE